MNFTRYLRKRFNTVYFPEDHGKTQDLPPYEFRRSHRAKRLQIRVLPPDRVEVVLPLGCSENRAHALVRDRIDWIMRALQKVSERTPKIHTQFPITLHFTAIDEAWRIIREANSHPSRVSLTENEGMLTLGGATLQEELCISVLKTWLIQKGKKELISWFDKVSDEVKLPYNKISVRGQKTRWGSCSGQKNISLNYKLLFLSPEQVRYLFIHELSHTRHMNHSQAFWALVGKLEHNYKNLDKSLNHAMHEQVPGWLHGTHALGGCPRIESLLRKS